MHRFPTSAVSWEEIYVSLQRGNALGRVECAAHISQFESQPRDMGLQHKR